MLNAQHWCIITYNIILFDNYLTTYKYLLAVTLKYSEAIYRLEVIYVQNIETKERQDKKFFYVHPFVFRYPSAELSPSQSG